MDPAPPLAPNENQKPPPGDSSWLAISRLQPILAGLILLFAVGYNLVRFYPEVVIQVPMLNDGVLHRLSLERAFSALTTGEDPTDPWLATLTLGYPLFHHYQHLPYLIPSILYLPIQQIVSLDDLFNWVRYLLLSLFPLSIFWSMRRFGYSALPAAWAGLIASLLSTNGLYGFDSNSYLWGGYGMYTQLCGMCLLPLALAQSYTTMKTGRGYFWSVLLLAATLLSHLVYGYIAFISLALFVLLPLLGRRYTSVEPNDAWVRAKRLVLLLALVVLVTAYFLLPYLLDRTYMNRSVWEEQGKYDAYGYAWTLSALVRGELFDFGRFPSLTILAGLGLVVCLWRWRDEKYRIPVALFLVWLLLYFGRPTWGVLLNLLPLSQDLHFHRLIAGIHLSGILLIGIALALPWQWALSGRKAWQVLVTGLCTAILLVPVYRERGIYLAQNASWMAQSRAAVVAEKEDLNALVDTLRKLPPGRVYAGLGGNWGADYKVGEVPVYALLQSAGFDMLGYLYHALSLNADIQVLLDENRPEQYNLFNVRYVVAPASQSFPEFIYPVGSFGRFHLYRVATTGYFDLVGSDSAFVGNKDDFYPAASNWLTSDLPRVKQHPGIFLEGEAKEYENVFPLSQAEKLIPLASFPTETARGQVIAEIIGNNTYAAMVTVERQSFVLLKVTYHPNWHVTVDGVEAATVMLMPSYVGVKVEPGNHQLLFEYRTQPWRLFLGFAGLLVLLIIAFVEWPRWGSRLPRNNFQSRIKNALAKITSWNPLRSRGEQLRIHLPLLGVLFCFILIAGLPLFQFKIMSGHDALEYLPRVVEFFEGLKNGQLLPRWAPDLSGGYGQPIFIFNPPMFYYLSSLFHALGYGFIASENLACFALLCLAGLGMYLLAGEFFGPRGGLVAAVAYLFAPYLLVNLYVRHSLADFTALAFLPWAFWGLERFIRGSSFVSRLIGPIAIALFLLSSNPIALISFPFLILFTIWLAYIDHSRKSLLRGLWCLVLGLGLSAFFWLPALVESRFVHLERLLDGYLNYSNHFVYPMQLLSSPWGFGISMPGTQDGMSFAIGPLHLLILGVAILILWRLPRLQKQVRWLILFSLAILLLAGFFASTPSKFLWDRLPLLPYLEFPWRFLSLIAFSTALLFGLLIFLLTEKPRLASLLVALLLAALLVSGFSYAKPESFLDVKETDYSPQAIAGRGISVTTAEEYQPVWVQERPTTPRRELVTLMAGEAQWSSERLSPTHYTLKVNSASEARLRMNIFYFPGWTLFVDDAERSIDYQNPQGLIELSLEPGEHRIELFFANTPIRNIAIGMSLLALVLFLVTLGLNKKSAVSVDN